MNPLIELKAILMSRRKSETVKVLSCTAQQVLVVSAVGVQSTLKNDGSFYAPGVELLVRDSTILGQVVREDTLTDYYV